MQKHTLPLKGFAGHVSGWLFKYRTYILNSLHLTSGLLNNHYLTYFKQLAISSCFRSSYIQSSTAMPKRKHCLFFPNFIVSVLNYTTLKCSRTWMHGESNPNQPMKQWVTRFNCTSFYWPQDDPLEQCVIEASSHTSFFEPIVEASTKHIHFLVLLKLRLFFKWEISLVTLKKSCSFSMHLLIDLIISLIIWERFENLLGKRWSTPSSGQNLFSLVILLWSVSQSEVLTKKKCF